MAKKQHCPNCRRFVEISVYSVENQSCEYRAPMPDFGFCGFCGSLLTVDGKKV